jgi:hypothetical protein
LKLSEPDFAIVPRFDSSSSAVIPIPLSEIVSVRASLSAEMNISKSSLSMPTEVSVSDLK